MSGSSKLRRGTSNWRECPLGAVTSCANVERIELDQAPRSIPNRHQLL
jgi:hypothetical protein